MLPCLILLVAQMGPADIQPPQLCVTIASSHHALPAEVIDARLDAYEALGVDMLRIETTGEWERLASHLVDRPFRIKLILYVLGLPHEYAATHAHQAMADQEGVRDWHFGPWHSGLETFLPATAREQMDRLEAIGLLDKVDEVVADLGPAGEGIYPANWTLGREGEEAFWFYGTSAQADFRAHMEQLHGDISEANAAWGLGEDAAFETWESVLIPPPGTEWARGAFWADVLGWYRDSKRDFMALRITQTQEVVREYLGDRAGVIVYLPGWAYSQAEWDEAVATASGAASIRLMMDNDWLMEHALARGCVLQYTGSENAGEVARIGRKLRLLGYMDLTMLWGENAGVAVAGQSPVWLAEVVTHYGLRGLDYTWDSWLWEPGGTVPTETLPQFEEAARHLHAAEPGPQGTPLNWADQPRAIEVEPGVWELTAAADTRLLSLFPDTVKGFGPELAVVEGGQRQRILLRFPLDLLPAEGTLRRATLVLTGVTSHGDEGMVSVELGAVAQQWAEGECSWIGRTMADDWARPGASWEETLSSASIGATDPGTQWEWDVTTLCREWHQGARVNRGVLLSLGAGSEGIKSFGSREHPDRDARPVLRVEFE